MRSLPSVFPAGAGLLQEIEPEVYAETGAPQVIDPPPPTVSVTVEVHNWAVAVVVVVTVVMTAGGMPKTEVEVTVAVAVLVAVGVKKHEQALLILAVKATDFSLHPASIAAKARS